jgi:hypothetical protein
MNDGVLASFEPLYATLGLHGWSPTEVDAMEVWQVARFLGDDDFDPVVRGSRSGLSLPSDNRGGGVTRQPKGANRHGRMDPSGVTPRTSDPGIILTGDAAR